MKSLKQNVLYLAIMAGLDVMCMAMKALKEAKEQTNEPDAGK